MKKYKLLSTNGNKPSNNVKRVINRRLRWTMVDGILSAIISKVKYYSLPLAIVYTIITVYLMLEHKDTAFRFLSISAVVTLIIGVLAFITNIMKSVYDSKLDEEGFSIVERDISKR